MRYPQPQPKRQPGDRIRGLLMTLVFAAAGISLIAISVRASEHPAGQDSGPGVDQPPVTVYKRSNCGCCSQWVAHLEERGFAVDVRSVDSTVPMQFRLGVPDRLRSCHTAEGGDYWIEGHVPADLIARLLDERPTDIEGLAVPGMPVGSPGMEGPNPQTYSVIAVDAEGNESVYATREGAEAPQ